MSAASVTRFTNYLVKKSEREGNTDFVKQLAKLAEDEIVAGNGAVGFLQTCSGNGTSATQAEALSCDEVGYACERAFEIIADTPGGGAITFPDFSKMNL